MAIRIVQGTVTVPELKELALEFYGTMIKGVVDIEKEILAFGGEWHMDANNLLIENGSKQTDLWGFNVHLDRSRENWLEYTSLINIRPAQNNRTHKITDPALTAKMEKIINAKITE